MQPELPWWVYVMCFGPLIVTAIAGAYSFWKIDHTIWYHSICDKDDDDAG